MSILKNKLLGVFGIYTMSNVFNAGIPFLLLPVLTAYLSPSDYGILSNFNGVVAVLVPLVGMNIMSSVSRQYIKDDIDKRLYVSTGLTLVLVLTIFFSVSVLVIRGFLQKLTGVPVRYLNFIALYALFSVLMELILAIWRMEQKAIHYGVFRVGKTLLELGGALYLIVQKDMTFDGSIYAMYIAMTAAAVVSFYVLNKKGLIGLSASKKYLKHLLSYGLPLVPHALSGVIFFYSDKLIITHIMGLSATGVYSVGFLVGQLIGLFQNSFNQAWVPWVYGELKKGESASKRKIVKITYWYFLGILLLTLGLWFGAPYLYLFVGKDFQAGMYLVLWVALGFAFNGMYKMVVVYVFYSEKTKYLALISFVIAALNIVLNFVWIPIYGEFGAALATVVSFFIQFLITWLFSSRLISMPWSLSKQT